MVNSIRPATSILSGKHTSLWLACGDLLILFGYYRQRGGTIDAKMTRGTQVLLCSYSFLRIYIFLIN